MSCLNLLFNNVTKGSDKYDYDMKHFTIDNKMLFIPSVELQKPREPMSKSTGGSRWPYSLRRCFILVFTLFLIPLNIK